MNLNKYTKAELINKFKKLETDNNNKSILLGYLLSFKNLILKVTLLTVIIKLLKRYKIIGKIWTGFNWISMSIFRFSMIDIYGAEYISTILEYIRSTHFYNILFYSKIK